MRSPARASERLALIEEVVTAPAYSLAGLARGRLVYTSTVEGSTDLWSLDLEKGGVARLTSGGVHTVARPRPESGYVVYTRDVSGGRELQRVYAVSASGGEHIELGPPEPRRVLGLAFDGERVALAAAGEGVELWRGRGETALGPGDGMGDGLPRRAGRRAGGAQG